MPELLPFLSFIGAGVTLCALTVGAYQLGRWGIAGQTYLWGIRKQIDTAVQNELADTIKAGR